MAPLRLSFLLFAAIVAIANAATPAPAPAPKVNLTAILEKGGQFTTLMRLLDSTQVGEQIENQVSNSNQGMTVFAPTDNAFQNLKPGTINSLSNDDQVKLILYHVLPKYYSMENFQTASNPVQTQALPCPTDDGKQMGLTITYLGANNVNISSDLVVTQINNPLSSQFPLAVYQVDKVLLPEALFGAKAPKSAPVTSAPAKEKTSDDKAEGPAADHEKKNAAYGVNSMGYGFIAFVGFVTMGVLF